MMVATATDQRDPDIATWSLRLLTCFPGAMLLGLLLSSPTTLADSNTSNVRISEKNLYSAEQISASLEAPLLPDPMSSRLSLESTTLNHAEPRHRDEWYDNDAWITDVGTLLYRDEDRDGYFTGFSLDIDADTRHRYAEVYVVVDIQGPSGIREYLHRTADFSLYGNTLSDEYRIDIELVQNFPAAEFDLFIELIDAHTSRTLDRVSARQFYNLSALPLESEDFDQQTDFHAPPTTPAQNDDVRVVEYAGSAGLMTSLSLAGLILMRRLDKSGERARFATMARQDYSGSAGQSTASTPASQRRKACARTPSEQGCTG